MPDTEFIKSLHAANDAGFTVTTERRHSSPEAKRAELQGDIFEIVIRKRLEVFWIGNSFDRREVQRLAAGRIQAYIKDYSDDAGVK